MKSITRWDVVLLTVGVFGSLALSAEDGLSGGRQRIPLDTGWQAVKLAKKEIRDMLPGDSVAWKDHDFTKGPLPTTHVEECQGWYRRNVVLPAGESTQGFWLRLENWRGARVACWVNGKRLPQEYWTGFLPVEWYVGDHLKAGAKNTITLAFWSTDWARVRLTKPANAKPNAPPEYEFLLPEAARTGQMRHLMPTGYGSSDHTLRFVGPTGPILLERRSDVFIDNVQAISKIAPTSLSVRAFLNNTTKSKKRFRIRCELYDGEKLLTSKEGDYRLTPNKKNETAKLSFACPSVRLWWPDDPKLYHLRVKLFDGSKLIDEQSTRVGFREVATRGRKFLLNGVPYNPFSLAGMALTYVRPMCHMMGTGYFKAFWQADKQALRKLFRFLKSQNVRMVRFQAGPYPSVWYDAADEEGLLIIDESAMMNSACTQGIELDEYWKHWRDNMLGMARRDWNHPSVVVWSLGNEVGHGGRGKIAYPRMAKVVKELKALDPTRPITASGDGDVYGSTDIVNLHYPQCGPGGQQAPGNLYPLSAFWLANTKVWPGYYGVGNQRIDHKPLFFGEWDTVFGWPQHPLAGVFGDEAFVGAAPGTGPEDVFLQNSIQHAKIVRQFIEAYRYHGVASPAPWCVIEYWTSQFPQDNGRLLAEAFRPEMVMLLPTPRCFFGDSDLRCTVVAFNDSTKPKDFEAHLRLEVNQRVAKNNPYKLWRTTDKPAHQIEAFGKIGPGEKKEKTLTFRVPTVDSPSRLRIQMALNADKATAHRRNYEFRAFPHEGPLEPDYRTKKLGVFDPKKTILPFLKRAKASVVPLDKNLTGYATCKAIVLGENSLSKVTPKALAALRTYVEKGGRVVCLQQDRYPAWLPVGVVPIGTRVQTSHAFVRNDTHPILHGVQNDMLSRWGKDFVVTRSPLMKTDPPGLRYLVDCGSGFGGLSMTSLAELSFGTGRYVLCQMRIADHLKDAPGAEMLLMNMVRYALSRPQTPGRKLELLVSSKTRKLWRKRFTDAGVKPTRQKLDKKSGKDAQRVLWCDDVSKLSEAVRDQVRKGATLVLFDMDAKEIAPVNTLFNLSVALRAPAEYPRLWWFTNKTYQTNLLDGVSNQDLFYSAAERIVGVIGNKVKPVTDWPVDVSSQGGLVTACDPAALCEIAIGKGKIVFCQLNLFPPNLYQKEGLRVFRQLLANLQLDPRPATQIRAQAYRPINIQPWVNAGFRDSKSGDGRGSGFDQGANDLREFPVKQKTFAGVRFNILDPADNKGNSIIVVKSANRPAVPVAVMGIRVGRRLDTLYALLVTGWVIPNGTPIAHIVLHYEDGQTARLPMQYGRHVTNWWEAPCMLPSAKPGWVGKNPVRSPITVFAASWPNPHPKKIVKHLDIVSAQTQCPPGVIALTAGKNK